MQKWLKSLSPVMLLYIAVIALVALGNGLSDNIYANYFKDAYAVDAVQRGFIEFPRELPGFLCALAIAVLSPLGDVRASIVAQVLSAIGLIVLGLVTPTFGVMLIFLFLASAGQHLFMPLSDSLGMAIAEPDRIGKRMGEFNAIKQAVGFVAALIVFFGFRQGWLSFLTPLKVPFLIASVCFVVAMLVLMVLSKKMGKPVVQKKKFNLVFRKEYKYYYFLTVLRGVQKQIAYVYGSWIIIDILLKKADTTAMLSIICSFVCIFFMTALGKWMDKFGVKKMMLIEAICFIVIYSLYGVMSMLLTGGFLPLSGWPVIAVYILFLLDKMSMQMGMVNAIYLRSIAVSDEDVTATLSMGTSLDHIISILAATAGGFIWQYWGSHWVFFIAAFLSCGNVVVALLVNPEKEKQRALAAKK